MCKFFSLVSNGKGKIYYADAKLRKSSHWAKTETSPDSHTSIADYFGFKGEKEDLLNKYEYNPLTQKLVKDQLNAEDDSKSVEEQCRKLDFKKIVPELIIKPIIHPFKLPKVEKPTKKDLENLKKWVSARALARTSVRDAVRDSIWTSVGASVGDSVGASVRDSVWAPVRDSVWAPVRNSVWAYVGSFFQLKKWKIGSKTFKDYPFQCCVDLWEKGLVPSYDGKVWRLHSGEKAEVVWEGVV